jgi:replicative DNA helicase
MGPGIQPQFKTAAEVLGPWRNSLLTGTPPVLYPIGTGELARVEVGPGLVTLIGGPPGAGKTAFTMQAAVDALRLTPTLRACVCNVEMPPEVLLDRQLARLSGIDLKNIRYRQLGREHDSRIEDALATLESVADRLCFVRPPFDLGTVARTVDDFRADLIVLDYIQRIAPPKRPGKPEDRRGSIDATMDYLRQFADAGMAVAVVSALARTKDNQGRSSYAGDGLSLASFRESSELEFGADDAFLLVPDSKDPGRVTLRHLKARYSEPKNLVLSFDRRRQSFTVPLHAAGGPVSPGELTELWDKTPPAGAGETEEG